MTAHDDDVNMTPPEDSVSETSGPTLQSLQGQINAMAGQLQQVLGMLQNLALPAQRPPQPPVAPQPPMAPQPPVAPQPSQPPVTPIPAAPVLPANEFSALTVKELAKQSLNLTEKQRLSGPENYQQWYQAISIQFRAL